MALWECAECTTRYSVGAPECPHCRSTVRVNERTQPPEEDEEMAKITVHGGPSNEAASGAGGEDVSVGSSSSTSSERESSTPEPSGRPSPSPARTTGSRSKRAGTAKGSSARGTGGGLADGGSETDGSDGGAS